MTETIDYGLRYTVRYLYDVQRLRIATSNRPAPKAEHAVAFISEDDAKFLASMGDGLKDLEAEALKRIKKQLKRYPISNWLLEQKGCGPTMTAVLISEVDIRKCNTVSSLWHYSGLSVDNRYNKAARRRRGEKVSYNPFVKEKMLKVLADSFIKSNSPWRKFYDDYKVRKQNTKVAVCMGCEGKTPEEKKKCKNCQGSNLPVAWGASDLHRANAARRYMIKMFMMELWLQWRKLEGLDTREPYCVEYLGKVHQA